MMPKGLIALKPNSSSARQQWLRGVFLLCIVGCVVAAMASTADGLAIPKEGLFRSVSATDLETELKQYKNIERLEANFEQKKHLAEADLSIESSGKLQLQRAPDGNTVKWTVVKPAFLDLTVTKDEIRISEQPGKFGKPAIENKEVQARVLRPLYAWLSMDAELIAQQYNIRKNSKNFLLQPKDTESPIQEIVLALGKDKLVSQVVLMERSKDRIVISFKDTRVTKSTAGAGGKNAEIPAK